MWYALRALDVLFFRDARPFDAGSIHQAVTTFPPSPLTLQGVLRAATLSAELGDLGEGFDGYLGRQSLRQAGNAAALAALRDALGDGAGFGRLRLRGPLLAAEDQPDARHDGLWFPMPAAVVTLGKVPEMGSRHFFREIPR